MSASYSLDESVDNDEASAVEEIEEDVQSEASGSGQYSSEFADATLEDGVSNTGRRRSSSQSMDEAIHSKRSSSHSLDEDLSPVAPAAPLVGIGSPPRTSQQLPSSSQPARRDVESDDGVDEETYEEDFVEGTMDFDRTPRRGASQSYTDDVMEMSAAAENQAARTAESDLLRSVESYSEDFAEGSATAGRSLSGTLQMSEALESDYKEASATSIRQSEEAERLRQETEMRARVEARRQQQAQAKAQEQASQIHKVDEVATEESSLEESKNSFRSEGRLPHKMEDEEDKNSQPSPRATNAESGTRNVHSGGPSRSRSSSRSTIEATGTATQIAGQVDPKSILDAFLSGKKDSEEQTRRTAFPDNYLDGGAEHKEVEKVEAVHKEVSKERLQSPRSDASRLEEQRELQEKEAEEARKQQAALLDAFFQKGKVGEQDAEAEKKIRAEADEAKRIEAEQKAEAERKRKEEEEHLAQKLLEDKEQQRKEAAERARAEEKAKLEEEEELKRIEVEIANKKRIEAEEERKRTNAREESERIEADKRKKRIEEEEAAKRVALEEEIKRIQAEEEEKRVALEEEMKRLRMQSSKADAERKRLLEEECEEERRIKKASEDDKLRLEKGRSCRNVGNEDVGGDEHNGVANGEGADKNANHEKRCNDGPDVENSASVLGNVPVIEAEHSQQVWHGGEWNDRALRSDSWWNSKKDWWSWSASSWSWHDSRSQAAQWKESGGAPWGQSRYGDSSEDIAWSIQAAHSNASVRRFERSSSSSRGRDVRTRPIYEELEAPPLRDQIHRSVHWSEIDRRHRSSANPDAYARHAGKEQHELFSQDEAWLQDFRLGLHFRDQPVPDHQENWKDRLARHLGLDRGEGFAADIAKDAQWLDDLRLEGTQFKDATAAHLRSRTGERCRSEKPRAHDALKKPAVGKIDIDALDVPMEIDSQGARASQDVVGPSLRPLPSADDLNPADFGGLVALAVGEVVDNLLELKYGSGLDIGSFVKLVGETCEGYTSLSIERMLTDLNSKQDLAFLDKRKEYKMQMRFGYRKLQSFEEVRRVVRLIPGTASTIVVLTCASGNPALDVVAAFRAAYSDSSLVVGRTSRGNGQPLRHFGQSEFCGAVAVDPCILSMTPVNTSVGGADVIADPPHAPEYVGLEPLLQYVNGEQGTVPAASGGKMVAVPPSLLAIIHATAPSEEMMKKVTEVFERPDVEPDGILEVFRKLSGWLKHEPESALTQKAIAGALGHKVMIVALHRHSTNRELCSWACKVIGWASRHHVDNAVLFLEAGGIKEICSILEKHRVDKDLHRHALYALGCLAHYGGGAQHAVVVGAVNIVFRSVKTHRDSPSVQINGCEVLRCFAESGEAPIEDLGVVAQEAKRAFPRDRGVHRAADSLLLLVVPRTVGTVGMLMDSKQADASVQNSGVRTLGQLAGFGGVAWKSCANVAVSRIIRAMENHKSDVGLQAVCLWALGRLAERVEAPTAGMFDAAHRAKSSHPESALVLRHAEQLLMYLAGP